MENHCLVVLFECIGRTHLRKSCKYSVSFRKLQQDSIQIFITALASKPRLSVHLVCIGKNKLLCNKILKFSKCQQNSTSIISRLSILINSMYPGRDIRSIPHAVGISGAIFATFLDSCEKLTGSY